MRVANVRVADASVYPIEFAAHVSALSSPPFPPTVLTPSTLISQLQIPTYGLAEQAANILRAQYNGIPLAQPSSVAPPSATSSLSAPRPTDTLAAHNGAVGVGVGAWTVGMWTLGGAVMGAVVLGL